MTVYIQNMGQIKQQKNTYLFLKPLVHILILIFSRSLYSRFNRLYQVNEFIFIVSQYSNLLNLAYFITRWELSGIKWDLNSLTMGY